MRIEWLLRIAHGFVTCLVSLETAELESLTQPLDCCHFRLQEATFTSALVSYALRSNHGRSHTSRGRAVKAPDAPLGKSGNPVESQERGFPFALLRLGTVPDGLAMGFFAPSLLQGLIKAFCLAFARRWPTRNYMTVCCILRVRFCKCETGFYEAALASHQHAICFHQSCSRGFFETGSLI